MKNVSASFLIVLIFGIFNANANSGSTLDQLNLGTLHVLENRAEAGNEKAQMKLAIMYLQGNGVNADIYKAIAYYRLAAERDIAFAQYKLARLYLDGKYVEPDPEQALSWLLRSAKLGLVQAQLELSLFYENGDGVDRDLVNAHIWLSIAASLMDSDLRPRQEILEAKMTPIELARAKIRSSICILNGYQDC
ncbi:MAG: sel1 repeat family protein [Gammaproteobacteria bacterium]|nr:sel1 repeat family protein [Gammaproteobacteria bacterium]